MTDKSDERAEKIHAETCGAEDPRPLEECIAWIAAELRAAEARGYENALKDIRTVKGAEAKKLDALATSASLGRKKGMRRAAEICKQLSDELDEGSANKVFSQKFKQAVKGMNGSVVSDECEARIRAEADKLGT